MGSKLTVRCSNSNAASTLSCGTPGRVDLLDRGNLKLDQIKWLVLDEADEMLSMGFIDDVEKILRAPGERQTALFSATMPLSILVVSEKFLRSPVTVTVEQPKAAPAKINQVAYLVPRHLTKAKALLPILETQNRLSSLSAPDARLLNLLIYCKLLVTVPMSITAT